MGHIEVILSFLIFMGFLIFGLYFFSPFESTRLVDASLDYAFLELIKNSSVEFEKYSVRLAEETYNHFNENIEITLQNIDIDRNLRAESSLGEVISSRRELDNSKIKIQLDSKLYNVDSSNQGLVILKFSEDFKAYASPAELDPSAFTQGTLNLYEVGAINKINIISEQRFSEILSLYKKTDQSYSDLKKYFNLPSRVNFGFSLLFDSGKKIESDKIPPNGVEVFSRSKKVEVLESSGTVSFAELIVRIW